MRFWFTWLHTFDDTLRRRNNKLEFEEKERQLGFIMFISNVPAELAYYQEI